MRGNLLCGDGACISLCKPPAKIHMGHVTGGGAKQRSTKSRPRADNKMRLEKKTRDG